MQGQERKEEEEEGEEATAQDLTRVLDMLVQDGRKYDLDVDWVQKDGKLEMWIRIPLRDDSQIRVAFPGYFKVGVDWKYDITYRPEDGQLTVMFVDDNGEEVFYWISNVDDGFMIVEDGVIKVKIESRNPDVARSVPPP